MTDTVAPVKHEPRLMRLAVLFAEAGCPDRAEKVQLVGVLLGRTDLTSTNQLTDDEQRRLIRWLVDDPLIVDKARRKRDELGQAKPEPKKRRTRKAAAPVVVVASPPVGKSDVVLVEPPPGDVEAAARAAADRFHARAGTIPDPPAREEIPPRVPIPHTAAGRYCMPPPGTCYCQGCDHWEPAPPVNYKAAIAALREKQTGGRR